MVRLGSIDKKVLWGAAILALVLGLSVALLILSSGQQATAIISFSSPVTVTGEDTAEPGIDIAADGTIYVNAPVGFLSNLPGAGSFLFRSDDGGASWLQTSPGLRANLPGGGDSDVALDPVNGTIYFTDLYLANSTVSVSGDKGSSWKFANPVGGLPIHDRQWLASPGGGVVYHVYNQIPGGLTVSKSVDGGMTYLQHVIAATVLDRSGCVCPPGTMIAEQAGNSILGLSDKVGLIHNTSVGGVKFARSVDGGLTWKQSVIAQDVDGNDTAFSFPVVANAGGGNLKAVWLERVGSSNTTQVRFSNSSNWGESWSPPVTLVSDGTSVYPWIDARGGKVSVALYQTNAVAPMPDQVPAGSPWYVKYMESMNGGASWSAPVPVDNLAVKNGPLCTEGANCGANRELLDYLQVALDPQDRANVAWTRSIDNVSDTEVRFARQN